MVNQSAQRTQKALALVFFGPLPGAWPILAALRRALRHTGRRRRLRGARDERRPRLLPGGSEHGNRYAAAGGFCPDVHRTGRARPQMGDPNRVKKQTESRRAAARRPFYLPGGTSGSLAILLACGSATRFTLVMEVAWHLPRDFGSPGRRGR